MSLVKHWLLVVLMVCFCSTGFTSPVASDSLAFLPDFSDMFPWMIEEETTESSKKITDQEEGKEYNKEVDEKTKGTDKQKAACAMGHSRSNVGCPRRWCMALLVQGRQLPPRAENAALH